MLKQSPSRIQKNRVLKVKHVLQVFLLSAVCAWLVFQLKHSYYKKQEFDMNNGEISISNEELVKLGRKGLLFGKKIGSLYEAFDENEEVLEHEEEKEQDFEFGDGEMREEEEEEEEEDDEDDDETGEEEIERGEEADEREEEEDKAGRDHEEESRMEREDSYKSDDAASRVAGESHGKEDGDGGDDEDEKQLNVLAKYDEREGNNDPNIGGEEVPNVNQTIKGSAHDKEELAVGVNNTEGSGNGNEQVPVLDSAVADTAASIVARQNYSGGSFESTQENTTTIKSGIHDEKSERPGSDEPNEKSNTTISQDASEDHPTVVANSDGDATPAVEGDQADRPTLPAIANEVKNAKDEAAE